MTAQDSPEARFQSEKGVENNRLAAYRGYFDFETPASARFRAAPQPGTYRTIFQFTESQDVSASEKVTYDDMEYEGNIRNTGYELYTTGKKTGKHPKTLPCEGNLFKFKAFCSSELEVVVNTETQIRTIETDVELVTLRTVCNL